MAASLVVGQTCVTIRETLLRRTKNTLRKLVRTFLRAGQNSDVWPVVLLLFAVLVPAATLLWFMSAAMRNERFAARQKLVEAYRGQLSFSQTRVERHWKEMSAELENLAETGLPSTAFFRCVQSGIADSVIVFDEQGQVLYPNTPSAFQTMSGDLDGKWAEAGQLEYLRKDFNAAANRYGVLSKEATNANLAARALQAQARCLAQAGRRNDAIRLVNVVLSHDQYQRAADPQGRLIVANAELMALELLTNRTSSIFQSTTERLQRRLMDYDNPVLAAPQRRFLMKELQRLSPEIQFSTLAAEELAAEFLLTSSTREKPEKDSVHRASLPGLWRFTTQNHRIMALVRPETLVARLEPALASDDFPADVEITLLSPVADDATAFVTLPAGARFPGWRLALSLNDRNFLNSEMASRSSTYLWTGVLVMAAMGILTLLAIRLLRRQTALARLKNDLAATVSHELKTPLSSMRVLVDTLLESDRIDERKARDYLQLIAQENDRLSRLIQNFLTFSRMERRKYNFHFAVLPARQIIDAAVESVRERFNAPGCRFHVQAESELPNIMADADALSTALINLLDNAWKYSEEIKHVVLRAYVENGSVVLAVRDNGIGIAPRETKKIFHPFHQGDQRLSRNGSGCGLGLSIVQFVVSAHHGSVSVESEPGRGSTFTISVPVAPVVASKWKEAIA